MRELTYGWNLEMQMRAARAGLRILEIPTITIGGAAAIPRLREVSSERFGPACASFATFARVSTETRLRRRNHCI
jgi:hypothetical protein